MGGRGASSGYSFSGKKYGTEYKTVAQFGNVKVVKQIDEKAAITAPMETIHKGRVYATLDHENDIKHITFYDDEGDRSVQIDVKGPKHAGMLPHAHVGYEHNEIADRGLTPKEEKIVKSILDSWERKRKKLNM